MNVGAAQSHLSCSGLLILPTLLVLTKSSKIMAISGGHGLPLAVHVASASPHETKFIAITLERRFLPETSERVIGDSAYDSDPLDVQIRERFGVQLVAPHNPTGLNHAGTQ